MANNKSNIILNHDSQVASSSKKTKAHNAGFEEQESLTGLMCEKKMLSNFAQYSSVWADSDEDEETDTFHERERWHNGENQYLDCDDDDDEIDATYDDDYEQEHQMQMQTISEIRESKCAPKKHQMPVQSTMTRYDPTLENHTKYQLQKTMATTIHNDKQDKISVKCEQDILSKFVEVSKDLQFSGKSGDFSLLNQFSKQREEGGIEIVEENYEDENKFIVARKSSQQQTKKYGNFFLHSESGILEESINWMCQSLTPEIQAEFDVAIRPQLIELYRTRRSRSVMAARKDRGGKGKRNQIKKKH